jgi:hypothetical protein
LGDTESLDGGSNQHITKGLKIEPLVLSQYFSSEKFRESTQLGLVRDATGTPLG